MIAVPMELNAESHKDYLLKMRVKTRDSEISKQWFQLITEEALLEKNWKLTEKNFTPS